MVGKARQQEREAGLADRKQSDLTASAMGAFQVSSERATLNSEVMLQPSSVPPVEHSYLKCPC